MDSPSPSPKVTRAVRTYGKRKPREPSVVETPFADASFTAPSPSLSNISPTHSISLYDLPPSSDDLGVGDTSYNDDDDNSRDEAAHADADEDDDMDEDIGHARYVRRDLKDDLARIDEQFDMEDVADEATTALKHEDGLLSKRDASKPVSKSRVHIVPVVHTSPSRFIADRSPSDSSSTRRITRRVRQASGSDQESSSRPIAQTSPQTSPSALHPINTPDSHSSPTPPTSQEMRPVGSKDKGKGRERHKSMEDEDSDTLPTASTSRPQGRTRATRATKEKRMKAPSKKELLETQKATARIKAEQRASLPRAENKLRISSLFEKLSSGWRTRDHNESIPGDQVGPPSDPIQPFSSSPSRPPLTAFTAKPSILRPRTPPRGTHSRHAAFVPSGLLGGAGDEAERPRSAPAIQDDVFQSNGLLDGGLPPPAESSDEDEEMPDVGQMLQQDQKKREQVDTRKKLQEAKLQYIQKNAQRHADEDDSDLEVVYDDMHAVADEEEKDRRMRKAKHLGESVGRQKQLMHAGKASLIRSPTKGTPLRRGKKDLQLLVAAAVPAFAADLHANSRKGKERDNARVNANELNKMLLNASEKQSRELTAQKEAEFYKKVGLRRDQLPEVDKANALEMLVRKGLENTRELSSDGDDEGQDDEGDSDWTPESDVKVHQDLTDGESSEGPHELPIATDDDDFDHLDEDNDENDENVQMKPRPVGRRLAQVINSDDEDDAPLLTTGRVLVAASSLTLESSSHLGVAQPVLNHRGSFSSIEERPEEGTDKENDARLMFDRGEDKENTAIASQSSSTIVSPLSALGAASGTFFSQGLRRTASSSSARPAGMISLDEERLPLQELPAGDDDDDVFLSPATKRSLVQRTPTKSPRPSASQSIVPLQLGGSSGKGKGLSAFFDDDEEAQKLSFGSPSFSLEPAAVIRQTGGGLSQFFGASGKAPADSPAPLQLNRSGAGFSQFMTPAKDAANLASPRKAATQAFELTLGPSLQPALEVDEKLLQQADEIFEKEQEYVVGDRMASDRPGGNAELYVNKHGFLTQTKPPSSPTSPAFTAIGSSVSRQPLSTIALSRMTEDEDDEDEEILKPKRLRRRSRTPDQAGGYRSSPSPSPVKPRNAFDVLGRKPVRIKAPLFEKKRLEKNEFVQGEAEESDEDAAFGFGPAKKKDEEEEADGEDQDRVLEGLVDDATMDDATLNEEKVLEKVQEHRAIDDAAEEKIARDAAEGKLRIKRRNNLLDFDDDESDDEDWEAKRARERMAKKRRIDGDTLEAIEKNPETRAFAAAYRIDDEENEFAHLEQEEVELTLTNGSAMDDEEDEANENEENEEQEVVTTTALRQQLQRAARGEETVETIDVDDLDWVNADDDDMEEEVRVREVITTSRKPAQGGSVSTQIEWDLLHQHRRGDNSADIARQEKWARAEGSMRNVGTGRASAVTGMNKPSRAGGGSLTTRRKGVGMSMGEPSSSQAPKKLAKAPSALSAVSSRRARFGS
ncbi:hypothetical protein BDW22DRAFT_524268 [Trametopsis cervina]|nr:hypothetical protein BDW22DRAFT_524268 [Trametopsis cervina]